MQPRYIWPGEVAPLDVPGVVMTVVEKVDALLESIDLDEAGEANAAIARVLADKLDEARSSDAAAVAMAVAGIAKELRATIDAIRDASGEATDFVSGLFAEVGDSPDA